MSGGTHATRPRAPERFRLRDSHPLRWPVPAAFGQRPIRARRDCRPLRRARPTPARQRRQPTDAARVWAPPRSLAATEGILSFPRGTEMFQFPRCPPGLAGCPAVRWAGCPIRTSPDRRLPAPPRGVSPRGRVLRRPPTPRHPPCAHHRGHSTVVDAAPRAIGRGGRTGARPRDHRGPRCAATPSPAHAGCLARPLRRRSVIPFGRVGQESCWCGARGRGSAFASCSSAAAGSRRPHASGCQSAGNGAGGLAAVEPRGIEPRTSAVQRRRSPG